MGTTNSTLQEITSNAADINTLKGMALTELPLLLRPKAKAAFDPAVYANARDLVLQVRTSPFFMAKAYRDGRTPMLKFLYESFVC